MKTVEELNYISGQIVDGAFQVHSELGPGLLESAYRECMIYELRSRGLKVQTEVRLPIIYRGVRLRRGYRIDLLVEDEVITELKAIAKQAPIHEAQLLSHLKLGNRRLGLVINFHVPRIKDGIKRIVNGL